MSKQKMNIAMVSPGWPLSKYPNGIIAYIEILKNALKDKANVWILSSRIAEDANKTDLVLIPKIKKHTKFDSLIAKLPTPFSEVLLYNRVWSKVGVAISRAVKNISPPPDIIEIEESFGISRWLSKNSDIPIVVRLHGTWFIHGSITGKDTEVDYRIRVKSEGCALRISRGITSPSLDLLTRVRDFYKLPLEHAEVIPNPITPVPNEQKWRPSQNKQTILFVGRFDLHKGGDIVINAFNIIASENPDVELTFVGPDKSVTIDGYKYGISEFIARHISDSSVLKRIHVLGSKNPDEIKYLRRNSTVTVMASRYENFSMSLLEAVATGCPVVASNVGGNSEIIIDDYSGILVEPESPNALAQGVKTLLRDQSKMNQISKNAIEDSIKRFHPDVIAAKTLAYYRKILG